MFKQTIAILKREQQERLDVKLEVQPLWKIGRSQADGRLGDQRVELFLWLLDNMGYVRNEDQVEFHRHLFLATIDKFYGKSWTSEMHRVMKMHNITEIQRHVIMLARRRLGKTVAVCLFQAAKMICIAGEKDIVLATNQRITLMIMDSVIKMMCKYPPAIGQYRTSGEKLTYSHKVVTPDFLTCKFLQQEDEDETCLNGSDLTKSLLFCYPGSQSRSKFNLLHNRMIRTCSLCLSLLLYFFVCISF